MSSLVAGDGLHRYKQEFGFACLERDSAFIFHPALAPALGSLAMEQLVRGLQRWRSNDKRVEYARTVIEAARLSRHRTAATIETTAASLGGAP